MAVFCIPKNIALKLKEAASRGEIDIKKLYEMNSAERQDFWKKYVNEEVAQFINAGFEKAVLDEQQSSLTSWVKETFSLKDKQTKKDTMDKIAELSQSGALNPDSAENFLSDLVAQKLGVTITAEEAQKIFEMSAELQTEFSKPPDQYGLPSIEYFKKRKEMEKYLKSKSPSNPLKVFTSIIGRATMLFSIKSPIVNIVGNTVQQLESAMEKRIVSNQYAGKVNTNLVRGYIKKTNQIFKETGFDVTRVNSYGDGMRILGEDIVHSEGPGKVRRLGRFYEDVVFKQMMSAPDVFFSSISFADTANLGATKMAKEEGLSGQELIDRANELFRDATSVTPKTPYGEMLRETAIADALFATFQNDSSYSKLALGIRKLFNQASGDLRIGDQIMPFVKTPANVVGMTLDAAGIGAVTGLYQLPAAIKEMKAGDPALMRQVAKSFTRAGLGMTIAFLLSALFDPEDFIGRYPTNPSERELLTTNKARENSLKINGKWVSLDYFGFLGGALVGFLYAKKYGKDLPSAMYSYGTGVLLQSQNIPGFESIKDLTTAIGDLKPEDGEGVGDTFAKFKTSALDYLRSRTIPGFVLDIAKAIDISEREVDSKNPIDKLKSSIPVLRQTLPEKLDVFGAVIKGEPWWSVMLFGSRVQSARDNKVINEVNRLNDAGFIPTLTRPEKSANSRMNQLKVQLGDDKFIEANKYFRNEYVTWVSKLLDSSKYQRMSDEDKQKEINDIRDKAILRTLRKFDYKKPKKGAEVVVPKKSAFSFSIVKQAYASELPPELQGKTTLTGPQSQAKRTVALKNFFDKVRASMPEEVYKQLNLEAQQVQFTGTRQKIYKDLLALREEDFDWYKANITRKDEKALLGIELTTDAYKPDPKPGQPIKTAGVVHRNPEAVPTVSKRSSEAAIIVKYADQYGVPKDLALDIAYTESKLQPDNAAAKHGFDGKTINKKTGKPYPKSSAAGLFMFTDATWDELKQKGVISKDAVKTDPDQNAKAAMWSISKGKLSKWDASKPKWGKYYTEDELKKFY